MKQGCGIHVKEHRGGVLPQLSPWSPSPGWSWGQGVPPHVCSTLRHLWSYWQLTFLSPAFQMYICNGKRITINFQLVSCFPDYIKAHTVWPAHLENRKQYHSKFSSLLLSTFDEGFYVQELLMMTRNHLKSLQQARSELQQLPHPVAVLQLT